MSCNCKHDIETRLTERFKEQAPEARSHAVKLTGYGLMLEGNTLKSKPHMPIELRAIHPLKKGGEKEKTEKSFMVFNFCPFCGVSLKPSEHQRAPQEAKQGEQA